MHGSPLVRSFLVLLFLLLAGLGVYRLLNQPSEPEVIEQTDVTTTIPTIVEMPFELTLSATAKSILIRSAEQEITLPTQLGEQYFSGTISLDTEHPAIFLKVVWQEENETPHFAKLQIEPPQNDTLQHFFEAFGNIDDVFEPELD